jgi:hypothetical protein
LVAVGLDSFQVEVHPYWQQQELLDACAARGMIVTCYSPLGNIDASKYSPAFNDEVIQQIAKKHNKSTAQVTDVMLCGSLIVVLSLLMFSFFEWVLTDLRALGSAAWYHRHSEVGDPGSH